MQEFARPSTEGGMVDESLMEDLQTIEDFFVNFQDGITTRMEEVSVRLVDSENSFSSFHPFFSIRFSTLQTSQL